MSSTKISVNWWSNTTWEVCNSFLRQAETILCLQYVIFTSRTGRKPTRTFAASKFSKEWQSSRMVPSSSPLRTNWRQSHSKSTSFRTRKTLSPLAFNRLKMDSSWSNQNGFRFFAQLSWRTTSRQELTILQRQSFLKTTQIRRISCSLVVFLPPIAKKLTSCNNPTWTTLRKWLTQTTDAWISLWIRTCNSLLHFRDQLMLMCHSRITGIQTDDLIR